MSITIYRTTVLQIWLLKQNGSFVITMYFLNICFILFIVQPWLNRQSNVLKPVQSPQDVVVMGI